MKKKPPPTTGYAANLTKETYFTAANTALTASKVITFAKSKELYKLRFIDRIERELSPSMKVGKAVDAALSGEEFDYESLTKAQALKGGGITSEICRHPFYESVRSSKKQCVLTGKLGDIDIAGIPDFIIGDNIIVDLKVSSTAKVKSWYWHVLSFRYHVQAALYRELWKQTSKTTAHVKFYHLVAWEQEPDLYKVKLFELPSKLMDQGWEEFQELAAALHNEKDFADPLIDWKDAELLVKPTSYQLAEDDEI